MPTFIALLNFTEKGLGSIKETTRRADAFRQQAATAGVTVREVFWTVGAYDGAIVADAPDAASMTAAMLSLARQGNVRTQTLAAFNAQEITAILGKVA